MRGLQGLRVLTTLSQAGRELLAAEDAWLPACCLLHPFQLTARTSREHVADATEHARAGELHNNSRMTWGKAFIGWAPPADALAALIRCNHRFALDGCGPCSYGGILWCGRDRVRRWPGPV